MDPAVDDVALVEAARAGHEPSFALLVDRWLDRCWEVAWRILRDRDLAADVAQDTMTTAWQQLPTLRQATSFGGWVLRIARNRALNRLERERRAVPTGEDTHLEPTDPLVVPTEVGDRIERDERVDLVWAAATALGERDTSILDLHLRHGMGPTELADELGVTANNAHQLLFRLRARLGGAIRAHVLWHRGDPRCQDLAEVLGRAGITAFGPATVTTIQRHAGDCPTCQDDQAEVLAPAALFSAVPLVAVPADLRTRLVASLRDAGIPAPAPSGAGPDTAVGPEATGDTPPEPAEDTMRSGPSGGPTGHTASAPTTDAPIPAGSARNGRAHRRRRAMAVAAAMLLLLAASAALVLWPGDSTDELGDLAVASEDAVTSTTALPGTSTLPPTPAAPAAQVPAGTVEDGSTTAPPEVAAPTDPPAAPSPPTDPPLAPPVTDDPTTTSSTTASTTSEPRPPEPRPVVVRFVAQPVAGIDAGCATPGQTHQASWIVEAADTVRIEAPAQRARTFDADEGSGMFCGTPGDVVTLVATGPGGSARATTTLPLPTPQ